jgi:beta-1,4-mannosyl-glycoprotein beta-1,4-N-acetylglucosaminyltransferase
MSAFLSAPIRVYDTFSFNGEWIVQLRLKYLFEHVDAFIIVESRYTHSGEKKDVLFKEKYASWFAPYTSKIHWIVIDTFPEMSSKWYQTYKIHDWMKDNHTAWFREAYQRDIAGSFITSTDSNLNHSPYYVHVSDADEIPHIAIFQPNLREQIYKHTLDHTFPLYIEMEFYYYNFHWKKKQSWCRAYLIADRFITEDHPLTYWRIHHRPQYILPSSGWHLSYFMTVPDLQRKLMSFAHRECDQEEWRSEEHIRSCIASGVDLFNRGDTENLEATPMECYHRFPVVFSSYIVDLDKIQDV